MRRPAPTPPSSPPRLGEGRGRPHPTCPKRKAKKKEEGKEGEEPTTRSREGEDASDAVSAISSTGMRRLYKQAMPLRGIGCVACNTPGKVSVVDEFVCRNAAKMTSEALYKHAALVYQQRVVEVAAREGVPCRSGRGGRSATTTRCTRSTRRCNASTAFGRSRW